MSELKLSDIWDDATNAVCQAMQESKMCKCKDGECIAAKIEPSAETVRHWNTRAVPDVPELVRYDKEFESMFEREDGKYVLHSQAAEIIAAKDASIELLESDHADVNQERARWKKRTEAAEAKLAQYEEQEPIGELCRMSNKWNVMEIDATFYDDDMHIKDGMKIYTSPAPAADLKSENERLREALEWYANPEIYKPHPHGSAFDSRDLSFKAKSTIAALKVEYSHDPH